MNQHSLNTLAALFFTFIPPSTLSAQDVVTEAEQLLFDGVKAIDLEDFPTATRLFEQACDRGAAQGCYLAGFHYANGMGVPEDPTKAAQLFQEGCDDGHGPACAAAATIYLAGEPRLEALAIEASIAGCEFDEARACAIAALLFEAIHNSSGNPIEKREDAAELAIEFYRKALEIEPEGETAAVVKDALRRLETD